jgi:uncharacterized protein
MVYWVAATILVVVNLACVFANMLMLPGNWLMVGSLCVFILSCGTDTGGPDWKTLFIVLGLAFAGEVLEMFTGSAKASKKGASRRAMALSLLVSMVGSIAGAFIIPVPVIGSAIGAIAGAAAGAFSGAWLGEAWNGTDVSKRTEIGTAAMIGRMIGMLAKLAVGAAIFVFQLVSLW